LLLVGSAGERFERERRLERLGLDDTAILREGYVPEERLWSLMAACDVLVNLRSPTMGETSGAVIRGLALGKPMLVSDVGWFAELPDDVALKIPVDEYEVATIVGALEVAADHAGELGRAAHEYVRREHDLVRAAASSRPGSWSTRSSTPSSRSRSRRTGTSWFAACRATVTGSSIRSCSHLRGGSSHPSRMRTRRRS